MSNGKGCGRRKFNKELERAYKKQHTEAYGELQKVDGRRTRIVIRDGRLVRDDGKKHWIGVDPATDPPTTAEIML